MLERLRELLSEQFGVEPDTISEETDFEDDLGADSLDLVELSMAMEEEYGVDEMSEEDVAAIHTVGDLIRYLQSKVD